jgi:DNA polymerase-1
MWETMSDLELCIDTETDQIDWQNDDILCMGIYDGGPLCYVVPKVAFDAVKRWNWKWYKALVRFFNINCQWILQNSKYDQRFLVGQYHLPARCTIDTMLLHGALDERKGTHDLKGLCAQAFDVEDWELEMEQWIGTSKAHNARYSIIPTDNLHQYVRQDVYYTWHLRRHLTRLAQAEGVYEWPFLNLLMPINDLLLEPEITGVQLDVNKLQDMREDYEARLEECEAEIADFTHDAISNPASHVQVAQFLYDELGVKMKKHMNKKPRSTDDEVIAQLLVEQEEAGTTDSDVYKFLLLQRKYRRIAKMLSSYINGLWNCMNSMGEYFNEFQPLGTETGRISSRGITKGKSKGSSLLTFPRPNDRDIGVEGQKIRSVVVPRPGHVLVNCDFSQAELRMAAHVSGDQFLKNAYINKKDLHSEVTKEVFGENFTDEQRQRIKVVNFRWLNGGDVKAQLYARGETISQATANELARRYDTAMATLVAWGKEQERIFHTRHYVQSIFGRKRRAPVINARNAEEIRKAAINFQIQGPSSDVTMLAAVEFVKRRKPEWECILLMTVHDSILVECKEEYKDEVGQVMKQAMLDTAAKYVPTVPYKVDLKTGYAWGDM